MSYRIVYTDRDTVIVTDDDISTEIQLRPIGARSTAPESFGVPPNSYPPEYSPSPMSEPPNQPSTPAPDSEPDIGGPTIYPRPNPGPSTLIVGRDAGSLTEINWDPHGLRDVQHFHARYADIRECLEHFDVASLSASIKPIGATPGATKSMLHLVVTRSDMTAGFDMAQVQRLLAEDSLNVDLVHLMGEGRNPFKR